MDYITRNISSIMPKRPDLDALYSAWDMKHRPSTKAMERAAQRDGMTLEAKKEQLFREFASTKVFSGFC